MEVEKKFNDLVENSEILIISKKVCKYCVIAKDALEDYGKITVIEIDDNPELFEHVKTVTGQKTVPNVWFKGKNIGGSNNVLEKIMAGEIYKKPLEIDEDF